MNTKLTATSTTDEFDHWLKTAAAGEGAVYHVGLLMADRQEDEELDWLATRVWWEGRRGGPVELVQSRLKAGKAAGQCAYIAIKRAGK